MRHSDKSVTFIKPLFLCLENIEEKRLFKTQLNKS